MKRVLLACILAASIAGCETVSEIPPEARLASLCRAYAATLTTLVPLKSEMSAGQIRVVDKAVDVAGPLCRSAEGIESPAGALVAVAGSLTNLVTVEKEVKR